MTKREMLAAAASAHLEWALANADAVPYDDDHAKGAEDYSEFHADRSADAATDDPLNSVYRDLIESMRAGVE